MKILNIPRLDNSCGGGNFSHNYIIGHQHFGLQEKSQKMPKSTSKMN
jgi:hypothetical protein